jgi:hypothetical protein
MASGMVVSWEPGVASGALGEGNVIWAFCHLPSMGAVEPSAIWPSRDVHARCLDVASDERGVATGLGPVAVRMVSE